MGRQWGLSGVLIGLAALVLAGCGGASAPVESAPAASSGVVTFQASDVKSEPLSPTEAQVLDAYDRAVTAYGWFQGDCLPYGGATVIIDGSLYRKVDYPAIGTLAELRTYLRSIFSEDVIEGLLDQQASLPRYRDIDGALYVLPDGGAAAAPHGEQTLAVEQTAPDTCTVNVTAETVDAETGAATGMQCASFLYQYVSGRWVFTEFHLLG